MTTMKALVIAEPRSLVWATRPQPRPAATEALLKIVSAGICGTDIHAWAGNQPFLAIRESSAMNSVRRWWRQGLPFTI